MVNSCTQLEQNWLTTLLSDLYNSISDNGCTLKADDKSNTNVEKENPNKKILFSGKYWPYIMMLYSEG